MHVLISGAGIAGPTLAWWLAKQDIDVTIVERAQSMLAQGQNIDLKGAAVTIMKKMGLMDQVRKWNTTEVGTRFVNGKNEPFASFGVADGAISFTNEFEILRGDLASILYEATRHEPRITYRFGTTIRRLVANDPTTGVQVEFSDDAAAAPPHTFDLAVAADGTWSPLRKFAFPSTDVTLKDFGMHAVYFTVPRRPDDESWWSIFLALRARTVSLRPDPHGTMRAMLTHMPLTPASQQEWLDAARRDRATQEALVRRTFADVAGEVPRFLDVMADAPDFHLQPVHQVRMTRWSNGRVVCVGDAGYAPTPLTGMGTPLAITGAYLLAGEIGQAFRKDGGEEEKGDVSAALRRYEDAFRPFVVKVQDVPSFVPGIAHPVAAWRRWLFEVGTWAFAKVVAWRWVASQFESPEDNDDGFVLPPYPVLDGKVAEKAK